MLPTSSKINKNKTSKQNLCSSNQIHLQGKCIQCLQSFTHILMLFRSSGIGPFMEQKKSLSAFSQEWKKVKKGLLSFYPEDAWETLHCKEPSALPEAMNFMALLQSLLAGLKSVTLIWAFETIGISWFTWD